MQMFILFVSLIICSNVVNFYADVYTTCIINNVVECCVFSCRCLYFLCHWQYGPMLCIFMQMFILFVSLTIWSNVVYFHAYVYTFCIINNMVECCEFSCRCLYLFVSLTIWSNVVYFHADVYTFCFVDNMVRMFCIFMHMFILFVSLTIWSNVVYFHADVYTFCIINNMVECCVFSCRCLYFLCH